MCRKVRTWLVLASFVLVSIFGTSEFYAYAGPAHRGPLPWRKKVHDTLFDREKVTRPSRHGLNRDSRDLPQNNCTVRGGLAYQYDAQGLNYGHGLANVLCPSTKPGQHKRPHVTIHELVVEAATKLAPPKPLVQTAPPRGKRELVGIPTWFWLDRSQWGNRSSSASADDLAVSITASAYELVIDPGDGSGVVTCKAPWTPYKGDPNVTSTCTHTYAHSGHYTITATARWGADWSASRGGGGTLPTISRSASFAVTVVQARSELIANP